MLSNLSSFKNVLHFVSIFVTGYIRESNSPDRGRRNRKKTKYKKMFSGKDDALGDDENIE